jgi:hypothetical protein
MEAYAKILTGLFNGSKPSSKPSAVSDKLSTIINTETDRLTSMLTSAHPTIEMEWPPSPIDESFSEPILQELTARGYHHSIHKCRGYCSSNTPFSVKRVVTTNPFNDPKVNQAHKEATDKVNKSAEFLKRAERKVEQMKNADSSIEEAKTSVAEAKTSVAEAKTSVAEAKEANDQIPASVNVVDIIGQMVGIVPESSEGKIVGDTLKLFTDAVQASGVSLRTGYVYETTSENDVDDVEENEDENVDEENDEENDEEDEEKENVDEKDEKEENEDENEEKEDENVDEKEEKKEKEKKEKKDDNDTDKLIAQVLDSNDFGQSNGGESRPETLASTSTTEGERKPNIMRTVEQAIKLIAPDYQNLDINDTIRLITNAVQTAGIEFPPVLNTISSSNDEKPKNKESKEDETPNNRKSKNKESKNKESKEDVSLDMSHVFKMLHGALGSLSTNNESSEVRPPASIKSKQLNFGKSIICISLFPIED